MSEVLSVRQKEGKLREKASFLGRITKKVPYGTRVTLESENGSWLNVKVDGVSGWMHKTSLTEKEIVLKADTEKVDSKVSDDELVLAGKGFNSQVEKSYKQKNPALNFALVDKMEQYSVNPDSMAVFVKDGGLNHV